MGASATIMGASPSISYLKEPWAMLSKTSKTALYQEEDEEC